MRPPATRAPSSLSASGPASASAGGEGMTLLPPQEGPASCCRWKAGEWRACVHCLQALDSSNDPIRMHTAPAAPAAGLLWRRACCAWPASSSALSYVWMRNGTPGPSTCAPASRWCPTLASGCAWPSGGDEAGWGGLQRARGLPSPAHDVCENRQTRLARPVNKGFQQN